PGILRRKRQRFNVGVAQGFEARGQHGCVDICRKRARVANATGGVEQARTFMAGRSKPHDLHGDTLRTRQANADSRNWRRVMGFLRRPVTVAPSLRWSVRLSPWSIILSNLFCSYRWSEMEYRAEWPALDNALDWALFVKLRIGRAIHSSME